MVIFQAPNKYVWTLVAAWLISYFTKGIIHDVAGSIFIVAGIIWAYEEIAHGVNWFRKLLGWVVLFLFIFSIIQLIQK